MSLFPKLFIVCSILSTFFFGETTTQWVVVQLEESCNIEEVLSDLPDGVMDIKSVSAKRLIYKIEVEESVLESVRSNSCVKHFEKVIELDLRGKDPDDPRYSDQWNLRKIQMPLAWDLSTGGKNKNFPYEPVIAIIDGGFYLNHEDVAPNIRVNQGEVADDGIDNDNNGFVDDVLGMNFQTKNGTCPLISHGTSVSGISAGIGDNGVGMAGISWDTKVMLFCPISSTPVVEEILSYIIDQRILFNETSGRQGIFFVAANMSFGRDREPVSNFPVLCGLITEMGEAGVLPVAAGPNSDIDIDAEGDLPNACPSEYLLAITSVGEDDLKPSNRGYGLLGIDLAAPGEDVLRPVRENDYSFGSGCSYAAPHVTGAAALLYSLACKDFGDKVLSNPAAFCRGLRSLILDGVDPVGNLDGITVTGGRLNVFKSIELLNERLCQIIDSGFDIDHVYFNDNSAQIKTRILNSSLSSLTVNVYDVKGRLIISREVPPSIDGVINIEIGYTHLPTGVYILEADNGSEVKHKSFIAI